MALSDVANMTPVATTTATAEAAQAQAKAVKGKNTAVASLAAQGAQTFNQMSDDEKNEWGAHSGDIEFVAVLWDGVHPQPYVDGGKSGNPGFRVVGYRLKALADIEYRVSPYKEGAHIAEPNFTGEVKHVAAGETFDVTVVEAGALISSKAFGGSFSGGSGDSVFLGGAYKQTTKLYTPVLKKDRNAGSIKNGAIETGHKNADGKAEVLPEFAEKFGPLYVRKIGHGPVRESNKVKPYTALAVAFDALYNNK